MLHIVGGDVIWTDRHRFRPEQAVLRTVLADKRPDRVGFNQLDILDRVAGDKTVLANHHGQRHGLADTHGLKVVVIRFLIGLGKQHDPAGVAHAHRVGMVVVDVDWAGKRAAADGQGDRQAVARGNVEHFGHVAQTARRRGADGTASGRLRADARGHGGMLRLDRDELGVHFAVIDVGGEVLRDLGGGGDRERAHDIGIDLFHRVGNGFIARKSFSDRHSRSPFTFVQEPW